jgi:hypothetical protein
MLLERNILGSSTEGIMARVRGDAFLDALKKSSLEEVRAIFDVDKLLSLTAK